MTALTANTPRKPAQKKAAQKPTTVKEWKKAYSEPVELPSGNYMRVRRIGMETLMATGKMPNSLMSMMRSAVAKGTGTEDIDMNSIVEDDKQLKEMVKFMDDLVVMVSVEPKVHASPKDEDVRDDEILYADEVDAEDKSFIFAMVTGGTADLESFRQTTSAGMAALPGREDVELPAV